MSESDSGSGEDERPEPRHERRGAVETAAFTCRARFSGLTFERLSNPISPISNYGETERKPPMRSPFRHQPRRPDATSDRSGLIRQ